MLSSGDVINNRYTVVKTIGGGAFGTVYLVSDSSHFGAWRAMKEMMEADIPFGERQEAVELFAREVKILKSLNHPGLPQIFDSFEIGGSHYIVMEYIYGKTLEEKIKSRNCAYDWEEVLPWAEELCEILLYLHTRRPEPVIFRDLKPSNIIITPNEDVMLIDFGIARHYSQRKVRDTYFMGTPGFSPPEQYGRGQSDGRSDVFALGATMYRLLTKADMEQYSMKFPPLSQLSPSVPQWLEKVIVKCLAVNPGERYQSVLPLLRDLHMRRYTSGEPGLFPAAVMMLLPKTVVRMASGVSQFLFSTQSVVGLKISIIIMAIIMSLIFSVTYCFLFGSVEGGDFTVKCIGMCFIISFFLCWNYNQGGHIVIVAVIFLSCILYLACRKSYCWQYCLQIVFLSLVIVIPVCSVYGILRYKSWKWCVVFCLYCFFLGGILIPNFMRARAQGALTSCKSNLKNIGTAMEMYSSDYDGRYPHSLAAITPNYLRTLPTCPDARRMSYRYVYETDPDIYTVWCHCANHTDMSGVNMPEYDSLQGLHEM